MDIERLLFYDELGQKHWWLVSKYNILITLIKKYLSRTSSPRVILDIGSAGGAFLRHLKEISSRRFAVDVNIEILNHLKKKDSEVDLHKGGANKLPFGDEYFNLVFLIDVMEHLEDDLGALKEVYRVLKPGGLLEISVPAFNCLYGKHDLMFDHKRRYNRRELSMNWPDLTIV